MTVTASLAFAYAGWKNLREAIKQVREAEREAFKEKPAELERRVLELCESHVDVEERARQVASLVEESRIGLSTGRLFNLYSKQIEKYQQETRSRATWSFVFAIFAMFGGLVFVFWGASVLLKADNAIVLAAGGLVSAIGGPVGAYITKTFLDVHRLSLSQLNTYFRQPVINDHILMAQRLADESGDPETRQKAYEIVIDSITTLIRSESNAAQDPPSAQKGD